MQDRPSLMIPQLGADPSAPFPDPESAMDTPDGLLAWGGDLDPVRLRNAYYNGIFPWYSDEQPILWWSPSMRCVVFPEKVHVSRRLQRVLRQQKYQLSADRAFDRVVKGCALPRKSQDSTWITADMMTAYSRLHRMDIAHSIEVWKDDELVGGLYGLALGRMFFGESMFSLVRDASKTALICLCAQLAEWDFALLDCQVSNPHLESLGAEEIPRASFLSILKTNVYRPGPGTSFRQAFQSSTRK